VGAALGPGHAALVGRLARFARVDGGAGDEQGVGARGPAVVGQRQKTGVAADQVVSTRADRAGQVGFGGGAGAGADGISNGGGAGRGVQSAALAIAGGPGGEAGSPRHCVVTRAARAAEGLVGGEGVAVEGGGAVGEEGPAEAAAAV